MRRRGREQPHLERSPVRVRDQVRRWRARGLRIAFVPTMGALHPGHLSLVELAARRADRVVVSIFVNRTQFGPGEDFDRYPRTLAGDLAALRPLAVDLVFNPLDRALYKADRKTAVTVEELDSTLEGEHRPGHFAGVALVVLKLLHIVEPDILILGQKDAQQAVVLETLVRDLDLATRVVRGRIVRERDGLAMSSRNRYLSDPQRAVAPRLHQALAAAHRQVQEGERSAARVRRSVERALSGVDGLRLEYVAVVDARSLRPLSRIQGRVLIPAAAHVGATRLIDNEEFTVK